MILCDNYKGQGNVPQQGNYWTSTGAGNWVTYKAVDMSEGKTKNIDMSTEFVNALCISK